MNINRMLMLATAVVSLTANAQVKLDDKNANAYDLGYGVEISNFLSTASATTLTEWNAPRSSMRIAREGADCPHAERVPAISKHPAKRYL